VTEDQTETVGPDAAPGSGPGRLLDVDALVAALRARVAAQRARGAYGADVGSGPVAVRAGGPVHVRFRPELGYSSKPVVGRPITLAKQVTLRALVHVFDDLARQTDAAVARAWSHADEVTGAVAVRVEEVLTAEIAARETAQRDIRDLSLRLDALARRVDDLQIGPRLARLERDRRAAPPPAPAPAAAGDAPAPAPAAAPAPGGALPAMDYESFEGRFRPAEAVHVHQRGYLDVLGDRRRVVDVGCGRGELIEILRAEGVDAYGVEREPDFVRLASDRGIPVQEGDGIAHVEGLAPGAVDGVVASHVVEHLAPSEVLRLVEAAWRALPAGGVLILETPNPESLVAGSVNFHRDLTHRRPIHPDTLAFVCESAGFAQVAIRRLSPVPDAERLPLPPPDAPGAAHLRPVVERLNDLVYGFQDYAVVARR